MLPSCPLAVLLFLSPPLLPPLSEPAHGEVMRASLSLAGAAGRPSVHRWRNRGLSGVAMLISRDIRGNGGVASLQLRGF